MLHNLRALRSWPLWFRLAVAGATLGVVCAFQLPLETEVPGDPFLLFFIVVIASTLAFGEHLGFFTVGLSTLVSPFFFEPVGSIAVVHAADLIKIELYTVLAGVSVLAVAHLGRAIVAAEAVTRSLEQSDNKRAILLHELVHRIANNFAIVASLIQSRAAAVSDPEAKRVLSDAIDQVVVMARVHRRLHTGNNVVSLDSERFIVELCADLAASVARGRPVSIECHAVSCDLSIAQSVPMGLIINELVTNALKHAFPDARSGSVIVILERLAHDKLVLIVEDDGVGHHGQPRPDNAGQGLVAVLAQQLGGRVEHNSLGGGSSFHVAFPYADPHLVASPLLPQHVY
jgi:two-component system, sensor histidine kinase PdtaS